MIVTFKSALSAVALLTAVGCSLLLNEQSSWDTDVPKSEQFDAYLGTWSPDGKKIAFQHHEPMTEADPGLADQLWIVDLDSRERRMVHRGRILAADWSSDGQWLVFHSFSDPEYLLKFDLRDQQITRLTGPDSQNPELRYTAVGRWSPSGEEILFAVVAGEPRGISVMNSDGSNARLLIPYGIQGDWFPDAERITYVNWDTTVSRSTGRRRQIYTANSDGSDTSKLTDLPRSRLVSTPNVSPGGHQIAFIHRGKDGSAEVFLMNADGTNIRQITDGPGIAVAPEWSPSGDRILFSRFIPNVSRRIYVLNATTLDVEPLFPAQH